LLANSYTIALQTEESNVVLQQQNTLLEQNLVSTAPVQKVSCTVE